MAEPRLATHDETGFFKLAPAALLPADLYDDEELAEVMHVRPATILQWKETGQIPKNCITSEGRYIKSVIDPLIEIFRKTFPDMGMESEAPEPECVTEEDRLQMAILHEEGVSVAEIVQLYRCDASAVAETLRHFGITDRNAVVEAPQSDVETMEPDRTYSRKKISFAPEDVLRMSAMHDEGMNMAEIAERFGCSQSTISRTLHRQTGAAAPAPVEESEAPAVAEPVTLTESAEFEQFVRDYWSVGTRAVDMLFLPPEVRARILLAVRETLLYAFEKLTKTESTGPDSDESEMPLLRGTLPMDHRPSPEVPSKTVRQEASHHTPRPRRGRPEGTGKYGCKTKAIRVPAHLAADVVEFVRTRSGRRRRHRLPANPEIGGRPFPVRRRDVGPVSGLCLPVGNLSIGSLLRHVGPFWAAPERRMGSIRLCTKRLQIWKTFGKSIIRKVFRQFCHGEG